MLKAMQPCGATFCAFTAAVENTYTMRLRELKFWSLGQFDVLHTQNIKINFPWASKERFFVVMLFRTHSRTGFHGLKFL
jgi:hypothetical protein